MAGMGGGLPHLQYFQSFRPDFSDPGVFTDIINDVTLYNTHVHMEKYMSLHVGDGVRRSSVVPISELYITTITWAKVMQLT
jgi:hypothetical protein